MIEATKVKHLYLNLIPKGFIHLKNTVSSRETIYLRAVMMKDPLAIVIDI
jgi:hypothetical protein